MAQATLDQIRAQIQTLDRDELCQLLQEIEAKLSPDDEAEKREAFHEALLASGLVKQISKHVRDDDSARPLIKVQGKPVSETIIEERR